MIPRIFHIFTYFVKLCASTNSSMKKILTKSKQLSICHER